MKRARPSWTEEEKATSTSVKDSDAALAHLEMLYNDTHSADITFIVGNERFNAHRIIVASSSRPFKALLMGHFREGQSKEITISDPFITPEIFKVFLKYIYTRKIEFSVANGVSLCSTSFSDSSFLFLCFFSCFSSFPLFLFFSSCFSSFLLFLFFFFLLSLFFFVFSLIL